MSEIAASAKGLRLSPARIEQFHETGYLKNLPLLDQEGIATLQREFTELVDSVPDTVDIYRVNNWHKANRWFYELGRIPAVLDYVEDLLGPDFYQWGGAFFIKFPHDESTVPWHQDARYWPLEPRETVTVWLAGFRRRCGKRLHARRPWQPSLGGSGARGSAGTELDHRLGRGDEEEQVRPLEAGRPRKLRP